MRLDRDQLAEVRGLSGLKGIVSKEYNSVKEGLRNFKAIKLNWGYVKVIVSFSDGLGKSILACL